MAQARQNAAAQAATIAHGLDHSAALLGPGGTLTALRELGHCRTRARAGFSHRIDVIRTRESAVPDFLRIALDRLLNRRAEIAEAFDEFRHPWRQPKHVFQHQDLAVAGHAGADADGRDRDLRRDAAPEWLGD